MATLSAIARLIRQLTKYECDRCCPTGLAADGMHPILIHSLGGEIRFRRFGPAFGELLVLLKITAS